MKGRPRAGRLLVRTIQGEAGGTRYLHSDIILERRFNSRIEPPHSVCSICARIAISLCQPSADESDFVLTKSDNSDL